VGHLVGEDGPEEKQAENDRQEKSCARGQLGVQELEPPVKAVDDEDGDEEPGCVDPDLDTEYSPKPPRSPEHNPRLRPREANPASPNSAPAIPQPGDLPPYALTSDRHLVQHSRGGGNVSLAARQATHTHSGKTLGEPSSGRVLTVLLALGMSAFLIWQRGVVEEALSAAWAELLFWTVLIVLVNLLPLNLGEITLTLDMPILLAIALLYPPAVATLLALVAALDIRELEGRVPLLRAIFNRLQVATCVLVASAVFHALSSSTKPSLVAAWATALAILAFHSVNVVLVAGYTWLRIRAWNRLSIGSVGQFLITYLGYGALALVLAYLYQDVGAWSVVTLLIPILVAREALLRAQRLQSLADRLRQRERLLERLFDRIVDERKDERSRIAADLHDDVLQSLIRVSQLGRFLQQETSGNPIAESDAREVVSVSDRAIQELRQVVSDLRASPLGRAGLVPTLRTLAQDLQMDWRVPVAVEAPKSLPLAGEAQLAMYQVAKEAMTNALKHAEPSQISVRLSEKDDGICLEVKDDGRGFDVNAADASENFGLGLMRERIQRLNGHVSLTSEIGSGTSLSVLLPKEPVPELVPLQKPTS
jgi:signal transduction histidine kinase